MRKFVFLAALLLLAVSCTEKGGSGAVKPESRIVKAKTAVAAQSEVLSLRTISATAASEKIALVIPKATGYIESIVFNVGDSFYKGDVLAVIKSPELEDRKRFAENAAMEGDAGLKQAEVNFELAEKTYRRYANLLDNNSVSLQEFDQVQTEYRLVREQVKQAKAKREQTHAALAEAETYLGYTKVRAPFDGVVLEKIQDTGSLASPNMPMMKIGSSKTIVRAFVNESLLSSLKEGMSVKVESDSGSFRTTGIITEISPDIDPQTRTFAIKILIKERLTSGMYAKIILPEGVGAGVVIPQSAISKRGQLDVVFVVKNGIADMRIVKTGGRLNNDVEIVSGLNSGEVYVLNNTSGIRNGDRIEAE